MSSDEPEFVQDPMFPPDWWYWYTGGGEHHARPPGRPNPLDYVHAASKEEAADKAWYEHRKRTEGAEPELDEQEDEHTAPEDRPSTWGIPIT